MLMWRKILNPFSLSHTASVRKMGQGLGMKLMKDDSSHIFYDSSLTSESLSVSFTCMSSDQLKALLMPELRNQLSDDLHAFNTQCVTSCLVGCYTLLVSLWLHPGHPTFPRPVFNGLLTVLSFS